VKAAKELLDRGLSIQRVRKALDALRAQLPNVDRPLPRLRVLSDGERLVLVDEGGPFEPLSGQLVMDFDVGALEGRAGEVMQLPGAAQASPQLESLYERFLRAVELDGDPAREDEALAAYRGLLVEDENFAAVHTNLGALHYRRGRLDEARRAFERALELDPAQPEARYNLGNLYADQGDDGRALQAWLRVLAECPEFADAWFNLGVAFARDGATARAREHLERYLALEADSEGKWAQRARALLAGLS